MASGLTELLERVKAATGPDRDLGQDIVEAFGLEWCQGRWWLGDVAPSHAGKWIKDPTASLDAALTLVERVLPGWAPAIRRDPRREFDGLWHAMMVSRANPRTQHATWGHTPALAVLDALLTALVAQGDVGGDR